jgi:hypothetical protein
MITCLELLETSIAQLETLAAFLSEQLSDTAERSVPSEARACREILSAVSTLIQTHQDAPWRPQPRVEEKSGDAVSVAGHLQEASPR